MDTIYNHIYSNFQDLLTSYELRADMCKLMLISVDTMPIMKIGEFS